jgi:hypothetical protein
MGGFSIFHWLVVLIVTLAWVVPMARICRRVGIGWGWSLLGFIPLFGVLGLWVIAFRPWPLEGRDGRLGDTVG